jgi:hypothetical protein
VQYDDINTIGRSVVKKRVCISDLDECYNDDRAARGIDYLELWLMFLNKFSNLPKPLLETKAVACMIHNEFRHFYLSDLKVIFNKIMKAEYGNFYHGAIDAQRILFSFSQYNIDRQVTIVNVTKTVQERARKRVLPLQREEFEKIREELKKTVTNEEELKAAANLRYQREADDKIYNIYLRYLEEEREKIE